MAAIRRQLLLRVMAFAILLTLFLALYELWLIGRDNFSLPTPSIKLFLPSTDQQQAIIINPNESMSLCHGPITINHLFIKDDPPNSAIIVGASNLIGQSLSREAVQFVTSVIPTEDVTLMSDHPLSWYHWEQLVKEGFSPQFVNHSDYHAVLKLLKQSSPSMIFYAPSLLFRDNIHSVPVNKDMFILLGQFLTLLEVVKDNYPTVPIILLVPSHERNVFSKIFESSLSTYNRLYRIDVAMVKLQHMAGLLPVEVFGSLKHACLVTNLSTRILSTVISQNTQCNVYNMERCYPATGNVSLTNKDSLIYREYLEQQTRDVVMTTYFTTQKNPQYKVEFMNNNFYFMANWFNSVYKLNLHMVIFHDDLSKSFIDQFTENCPFIEFVKVYNFNGYSPNDRRYFLYYDYILTNRDVRYALMTDLRDIKVINNPFEMMDTLGAGFVYLGIDNPFHETSATAKVRKALNKCFSYYPHGILGLYGNHNPGVLGGKRGTILSALSKYIGFIKMSSRGNCNTPAASYLFHTHYFDRLYTGWPLQLGFNTNQPHPPGSCVIHKWDEESWS